MASLLNIYIFEIASKFEIVQGYQGKYEALYTHYGRVLYNRALYTQPTS